MNPFSICLIAKNEEKKIERCLSAASKLNAEIVLTDTGSTDRTKELAMKYTNKIYNFEWCNDFSAARNFSISKASYDWVLVLDCDEYVESFDLEILNNLTKVADNYFIGEISILSKVQNSDETIASSIGRFFNRNFLHFEDAIHEQLLPLKKHPVIRASIPLTVLHEGYAGTFEERQRKSQRNRELLLASLQKDPNNPYLYYKLGVSHSMAEEYKEALAYYQKALEYDINPAQDTSQLLVIAYGETLLHLRKYEEALSLLNIYDEFSRTADFKCLIGLIYMYNNQPIKAILEFMKALTTEAHFRSDTNNNYPRYYIALIYELMGDKDNAIKFYQSCGNYEPALKKLSTYNL